VKPTLFKEQKDESMNKTKPCLEVFNLLKCFIEEEVKNIDG